MLQGMTTVDDSPYHLLNFLVLTIYILSQGVFYLIKKRRSSSNEIIEGKPTIRALQIDLKKLETKVVDLDKSNDGQGIMINNKLDLLINQFDEQKQDIKEMKDQHHDLKDRVIRIEEFIKHRRR